MKQIDCYFMEPYQCIYRLIMANIGVEWRKRTNETQGEHIDTTKCLGDLTKASTILERKRHPELFFVIYSNDVYGDDEEDEEDDFDEFPYSESMSDNEMPDLKRTFQILLRIYPEFKEIRLINMKPELDVETAINDLEDVGINVYYL